MSETARPPAPPAPDIDRLPLAKATVHPSRLDYVRAKFERMAEYLAAGSIPNARWEEIRPVVMKIVAATWNDGVRMALVDLARSGDDRYAYQTKGTLQYEAAQLSQTLDLSEFGGLVGVERVAKRLAEASARKQWPQIEAVLADARERLVQIRAISDPAAWLAGAVVKRNAPGTAAPAEPPLPPATRAAQKAVYDQMRKVSESLRGEFTARVVERVRNRAEETERLCAELRPMIAAIREENRRLRAEGKPVPWKYPNGVEGKIRFVEAMRPFAGNLVAVDPNTFETTRHPDGEARALAFAKEQAEAVFALWTRRNVEKLAPIIEAKGGVTFDLRWAKASYDGVQTAMKLAFPDGAAFDFRNAVEWATSPLGLPFPRFPARFHDVTLPDGSPLKSPSEARVRAAFCPDAPAAEPEVSPGPRR